jgi:hypothetical protein
MKGGMEPEDIARRAAGLMGTTAGSATWKSCDRRQGVWRARIQTIASMPPASYDPPMGTYRDTDEQRAAEVERERIEREARERAEDVAVIRDMKNPLHGAFTVSSSRNALVATVLAFVVPGVLVLIAAVCQPLRDTAAWAAVLLGATAALAAILLGVRSVGNKRGRGWSVVAIVAGLLALPWAFLCALVATFMGSRMGD